MSACNRKNHRCGRLKWIVFAILLCGLGWTIVSTTPKFQEQKRTWMEKAIRDIKTVDKTSLFAKPAYLSANQFREEITEVLFEEKKVKHDSIRGIYVTAETAGSDHFWDIIDALVNSGGNAVVIDIERGGGQLAFTPEDEYLASINPGSTKLDDLKSIIKELHRKDIYVIARQVVFNDPFTVGRKPEWGIHYTGGSLYDGRWLDPSHPEAQRYNLLITREVAKLGFDEVQYDYIRFPDGYHIGLDYYYDETAQERWEIINEFLAKAHAVTQEFDISLGMDVFGATVYGSLDWSLVGQNIAEVAKNVDVIYPMTYPSHISPGYNGFNNPYGDPYPFIYDAIGKFIKTVNGNAEIRTWIQGFPLRIPNYGPWFVKAQVQGTYDAGANDFIVWSPGNIYTTSWSSLGLLPPPPPEPLGQPLSNAKVRVSKKPFGLKVSPSESPVSPERFTGYHAGTDFEILPKEENEDIAVQAICEGQLKIKRDLNGYGGVAVQSCEYDEGSITVLYGHLDLKSIKVNVEDLLKKGQSFALLGKGFSDETDGERKHLHLSLHKGTGINFAGYVQSENELTDWLDPLPLIED